MLMHGSLPTTGFVGECKIESGSTSDLLTQYFAYEAANSKDVNLAPPVLRTVWVLLSISTIVVTTRFYVKWRTTRKLYLDDYLIAFALVLAYLHAVFITIALINGLGRHIFFLEPGPRYLALKYGFISLVWSYLSPMVGRLSFCVFLLCVVQTDPLAKKWPIWIFLVLQVVINVVACVLLTASCGTHLEAVFNMDLVLFAESCLDLDVQTDYAYFAGSFNTLTDLFLTVQPALLVVHTKLGLRKKLGIASLLCLSVIAMIAAIVRTVGANALSDVNDYTYDLAPYVTWVAVELNVVLTVTSIPLLRPLAKETRERTAKLLRKTQEAQEPWDDTVSLRSISKDNDKTGAGVGVAAIGSTSSREGFASQQDPFSITRTVEVSVSHADNDSPFVHAALVGLLQGQQMERLAGR